MPLTRIELGADEQDGEGIIASGHVLVEVDADLDDLVLPVYVRPEGGGRCYRDGLRVGAPIQLVARLVGQPAEPGRDDDVRTLDLDGPAAAPAVADAALNVAALDGDTVGVQVPGLNGIPEYQGVGAAT